MKAFKKWFKAISLFLSGLILFQSCSTYKTPVSLEDASKQQKEVKIVTLDDDTYKYKYIVYEDGQFYGVKDNPGEDVKFPIETEEVATVMMKEGGIPTWVIIVGSIVIVLGVLYLIALNSVSVDMEMI